jgi:transposase InsO family protein
VNDSRAPNIPVVLCGIPTLGLFDSGAMRSCVSKPFFDTLPNTPSLEKMNGKSRMISASGGDLEPQGKVILPIQIGNKVFKHLFVVCLKLHTPLIIGFDAQKEHRLGTGWSTSGKLYIHSGHEILVNSIMEETTVEEVLTSPILVAKSPITIPPRSIATCFAKSDSIQSSSIYDLFPHEFLTDIYPGIKLLKMTHISSQTIPESIPLCFVNFSFHSVHFPKNVPLARLQQSELVSSVNTSDDRLPATPSNTRVVTSPADVPPHTKVKLPSVSIPDEAKRELNKICDAFPDIFSQHAGDIGHTKLVTMEIDTGDHMPIAQKPYNLALKHYEWVQGELDTLEKAGIIQRSVSPWASPIVVVPKRQIPGQPPERRLCVDYRLLNSLLPPVQKGHSKAKGVLTLSPLPKIDQLYAQLKGGKFFTNLDLRAAYHHIALSEAAQPKSAFVTPFGKFEYKKVPFGLAQAPAYFQRLVNEVLSGLGHCSFAYLDDILIFSKDIQSHLQHIRLVFERLRTANLKIKLAKCDFFKTQLHYLGHIISADGLKPLPTKVKSVQEMPPPKDKTQVRQLLGMVGYYRKFIPNYADVSRPLTQLTRKNSSFEWTDTCQKSFETLKQALISNPILRYPDPAKPYILFTDASKYAWSGLLTQEHFHQNSSGQWVKVLHPITYISGLFQGSQKNWATLTKEAFAIYRSVTKLSFYLSDADVILRSDHMPLKKFLEKETLNTKVNNWAVELSPFRIKFQFIKGIKNTLADTLSRLIEQDLTEPAAPEKDGHEFGYFLFEEPETIVVSLIQDTDDYLTDLHVHLPVGELIEQQANDFECKKVLDVLNQSKALAPEKQKTVDPAYFVDKHDGLLYYRKIINDEERELLVIPRALVPLVMQYAHNSLGHNGTVRMYNLLRQRFFWKGLRVDTAKWTKQCFKCREQNVRRPHYHSLHLPVPSIPMQHICMDLIGPFKPITSDGNLFALTCIDLLTNYAFAVPIPNKNAETVINAYLESIYSKEGGSAVLLTDNGREFNNTLWKKIATELNLKHIFSSPWYPQGNGRIENFHNFLKTCIRKYVHIGQEWDKCLHIATYAYNCVPHQSSRESPFFLMKARDPILHLSQLLTPKIRSYFDKDSALLYLDQFRGCLAIAHYNIKLAREQQADKFKEHPVPRFYPGASVVVRNHKHDGVWKPKYERLHRVIQVKDRQLLVEDCTGFQHLVNIADVAFEYPANLIANSGPEAIGFGRRCKYIAHPKCMEDLKWVLTGTLSPRVSSS